MKRMPASQLEYPGDGLHYVDGEPFTGITYTLAKDGSRKSEVTYRDGLQWGPANEWYRSGRPMVEATYFKGVLHGRAREWHANGQLAEDGDYEYGFTLWEKMWDEHGNLTRTFVLKETDSDFQRLAQCRRLYGAGDPAA